MCMSYNFSIVFVVPCFESDKKDLGIEYVIFNPLGAGGRNLKQFHYSKELILIWIKF